MFGAHDCIGVLNGNCSAVGDEQCSVRLMAWSKESRQSRGYGAAWDQVRKVVLARDCWLCQCNYCKVSCAASIATEVDHIVSKANAKALKWTDAQIDAEANLQAINSDCHKRKTKEEQGKTLRAKVRIGADGWPVVDSQ